MKPPSPHRPGLRRPYLRRVGPKGEPQIGPRVGLALLLLLALLLPACGDAPPAAGTPGEGPPPPPPTLRFSAIPDQDPTNLEARFGPFARYLEARLGVPVAYVPTTNYAASVTAFTNGQILFAWFGGLSGVQARHEVDGARAIAQGIDDPTFVSYLIAHHDTGIERSETFPDGLRGRTFTFGSRQSTSGRLMPEFFIRKQTGLAPEDFFSHVAFSGAHDKTVEAVASGAAEVGAVNYKVYERRVKEGKTDPDVCRVVWVTPPYADYNFTAHPKLEEVYGEGFTDTLQQAIVDLDDAAILAAFQRASFVVAENTDYDGILEVAEALGFLN